jgi:hypothetical protein
MDEMKAFSELNNNQHMLNLFFCLHRDSHSYLLVLFIDRPTYIYPLKAEAHLNII